ncbi:MAG TPA: ABC transporter ATP-binding protein [Vicinamibacterales bacterium]|nr:ABC transporter ATP-binding protein [Vicinamibacterales bacterium]
MTDVKFDRVSKRYRVRRPAPVDASAFARLLRGRAVQDFWAVRDVSFEVPHGQTLGVIGHNGAGKSTLLKLMSRITAPTAGEIILNGRVAALIEVGSGFHPELTGRENVFLNGAILGMRRREIAEKFDRIVEFAGVAPFIDVPVKWYSSGMYVRLGFAIAAHLEPDILLVDEVLAVGDAAFQLQCYDRLAELRHAGTTMLFISHDLLSIEKLCDRVVLMEQGRIVAEGAPHDVVLDYQRLAATRHVTQTLGAAPERASAEARIEGITFVDEAGQPTLFGRTGNPLITRVQYAVDGALPDAEIEVFYYSHDGRVLHCQQSTAIDNEPLPLTPGRGIIEFVMPGLGLQPGMYSVGASIRHKDADSTLDWFYGRTLLHVEHGKYVRGYFYTPHQWRVVSHEGTDGRNLHV